MATLDPGLLLTTLPLGHQSPKSPLLHPTHPQVSTGDEVGPSPMVPSGGGEGPGSHPWVSPVSLLLLKFPFLLRSRLSGPRA